MAIKLNRTQTQIDRIQRNLINENWQIIEQNYNNVVQNISEDALNQIIDSSRLIWQNPVNNFGELQTIYPDANEGFTAQTLDNGRIYRFSNGSWDWLQTVDTGPVNAVRTELNGKIDGEVGINPQMGDSQLALWQELEQRQYNVRWVGNPDSINDTAAILESLNYAKSQGFSKIFFPKRNYRINNLNLENFTNVIIDFSGSTLIGVNGVEGMMITLTNNNDFEMTNFTIDGNSTFYRGIRILENNSDIRINNFDINRISPIIRSTPTNVESVAIEIDLRNNHDININNFTIDGVYNNNNGVIGDGIGTSRGILIRPSNSDRRNSNINISDFIIKNVISEDGDGIQCTAPMSSTSTFIDANFFNFYIDNCMRRGIKTQFTHGCKFDKFTINHSDRVSFDMSAGISALSQGHHFSNFEMNVRAIKGFEFSPFEASSLLTTVKDARIIMDDVAAIEGSTVFAIDVVNDDFITARNIHFYNIYTLAPNTSMIVRTYSRGLKVINADYNSYRLNGFGLDITYTPGTIAASDGTFVSHSNFEISNVIADDFPLWTGNNTVVLSNGIVKSLQSRNQSLTVYNTLSFKRVNVQVGRNTFIGDSIPLSGTFRLGDTFYSSSPVSGGYIGWVCVTAGSPGVWRLFGQIQ